MVRTRTAAVLAVLVCLLAIPALATASPTTTMIQKVNAFRVEHGLGALRVAGNLDQSASAYSNWMMSNGYFGHLNRIQASGRYHTLGEIIEIHRGARPGIGLTFNDWLNSPEHRAVMLYSDFSYVGAGFTEGTFQGRRSTIWVMHFGR